MPQRVSRVKSNSKKDNELVGTMAAIKKRYGENTIAIASSIPQPDRISTGIFMLDFALLGGIPYNRTSMFAGERHSGKLGRAFDHVLTPEGWVQYRDLQVGDQVIGSNGCPTTVVGVFPRGVLPMYKVAFTDKSSIIVGQDHLWQVQTRKQAHCSGNHFVMSTEELFHSRLRDKNSGMAKYRIPLVAPVQYTKKDLPIHPYILGVLLANGYLKTPVFTTNDTGVVDGVRSYKSPSTVVREHACATSTARRWYIADRRNGNRILQALRELALFGVTSRDKFVPEIYLRSCVEDRLALLHGLMDCDGSTVYLEKVSDSSYAGASYHTYSRKLALGVQELVQSLGGTASIAEQYREEDDVYEQRVAVMLPVGTPTFRHCARKVEAYEDRKRRGPIRSISYIEPDEPCEGICIAVEASNGLYVTEQHIVTHNTTLSNLLIASAQQQYPEQTPVFMDVEGTFDATWAGKLGVNIDELPVVTPDSGEMAIDVADALLESWETSLLVVDSIAALTPMAEIASSAEDAQVAMQARLVSKFVRRVTSSMIRERQRGHAVTIFLLNQYRTRIGGFIRGDPRSLPGGRALEFSTSVQGEIKNKENKGKTAEGVEAMIGNEHAFTIKKNKLNGGPRSGEFVLVREVEDDNEEGLYEGQIDDSDTVLAYAKKFGFYTGAGSSWKLEFGEYNYGFGKASQAIQALREDREFYWALRTLLIKEQAAKLHMPEDFIERII